MTRTVLIIEDDQGDFEAIKDKFSASWKILPNKYELYGSLFDKKKEKELLHLIEELIISNYKDIGMIVLDISLLGNKSNDQFGLDKVLPKIRNMSNNNSELENWCKQVPIIAFTRHADFEHKRLALSSNHHVHTYITKKQSSNDVAELQLTAEALYSIFSLNLSKSGHDQNISNLFKKLIAYLESKNTVVVEQFEILRFLINKNHEENQNMLNAILSSSLTKLTKTECDQFLSEFSEQLRKANYDVDKFESKLKERNNINGLKKGLKSGSFTVVTEFIFNIFTALGWVIDGPVGVTVKIISYSLIALCKVLEKRM